MKLLKLVGLTPILAALAVACGSGFSSGAAAGDGGSTSGVTSSGDDGSTSGNGQNANSGGEPSSGQGTNGGSDAAGGASGDGGATTSSMGGDTAAGGDPAAGGSPGSGGAGVSDAGAGGMPAAGGAGTPPAHPECGVGDSRPLFYSTLDDLESVAMPAYGGGATASFSLLDAFAEGYCGGGLRFGSAGELLAVPALHDNESNFGFAVGSVDFFIKPSFAVADGKEHVFFHAIGGGDSARPELRLRKAGAAALNHLQFMVTDGVNVTETQVAPTYSRLVKDQWTRVTVVWNFTRGGQQVRIFLDGDQARYSLQNGSGVSIDVDLSFPTTSDAATLYIGNADLNSDAEVGADAVLDDFRVYPNEIQPTVAP